MTLAPKTFGATVGDGMAALANSWGSTTNTLQQQALANQNTQADMALKQQAAQQQAAAQQSQESYQQQQ